MERSCNHNPLFLLNAVWKKPRAHPHSEREGGVQGGAPSENQSERWPLPGNHFISNNCPVQPDGCPLVRAGAPARSSQGAHRDLLHLRVKRALVKHEIVIIIRSPASTPLQACSPAAGLCTPEPLRTQTHPGPGHDPPLHVRALGNEAGETERRLASTAQRSCFSRNTGDSCRAQHT